MDLVAPGARRGDRLRPHVQRTHPPQRQGAALARGQATRSLHARSALLIDWLRERPVVAGVLGAATIAFSAILVALADVTPETAALFRCTYALPALAVLAIAERRRLGPRARGELAWGVLAGAFFAGDLIFWHHAIENVGAGLATVLANLQVVLVAFLAWA